MKIDRPHSFPVDEAVARIRALTDYWDKKYGTRTDWRGSDARINGKVRGISFDGNFRVEEHRLHGEVKVGFLAEKIGGRAYVERKLEQYLSPSSSLEDLRSRV